MQVDLSDFFSTRGTLHNSDSAELAVAVAFAAAANAAPNTHHRFLTASETVAVELKIHVSGGLWSRQLKDVVLRCVDRAMGRVYPPLDVLQYIGADSPAFTPSGEGPKQREGQGAVRVVFHVRPSAALFPPSLLKQQHTVEGAVVQGLQLPKLADVAALAAAASESMKDTFSDMDLWYRARAAHQQYDSSIPLDSTHHPASSLLGFDGCSGGMDCIGDGALLHAQQQQMTAKLEQLQWQLARWLVELFLNEGGWARPQGSSSSSPSSSSSSPTAAKQRSITDRAVRRLFHTSLRPVFPHVVDAALFSHPMPPPSSTSLADVSTTDGPRRQLHADVRGMEWDGLLLGCTTRYAYVAVPYFVSASESTVRAATSEEATCVWSLISRLPIPAFMCAQAASHDGAGAAVQPSSSAHPRKRARTGVDDGTTSLAQAVLARCFNVEEVMRHDTHAAAVFRLAHVPHIVTVRAHRVYCTRADATKQPSLTRTPSSRTTTSLCAKKPHPAASPYKLSMVLEDAHVIAHRPADEEVEASVQTHWAAALFGIETTMTDGKTLSSTSAASSSSSLAHALHTFPDVVSVVRESCHRFLRSHERFCSIYDRCMAAKTSQGTTTAPVPQGAASATEDEASGRHSVDADAHKGSTADSAADDGATCKELPSQAMATQQLQLLSRAEVVYSSIADSMSVHYKKLRGASRVAIPAVRTTADVATLEESNNVEFKAKVGITPSSGTGTLAQCGRGQQASTMDTERLRNTIAAMAASRGGVVVIGVADDGRIIGHAKQLEVGKHLRISGFCPAMVKDAVQIKELRWLQATDGKPTAPTTATGSATGVANTCEAPMKRAMPENWWKAGSNNAARVAAGSDRTTLQATPANSTDLVITVISVEKGQAPFYATAKNAPPYERGCASTVVMPTVVLARRLMKELT
jgi:hypothetical protein